MFSCLVGGKKQTDAAGLGLVWSMDQGAPLGIVLWPPTISLGSEGSFVFNCVAAAREKQTRGSSETADTRLSWRSRNLVAAFLVTLCTAYFITLCIALHAMHCIFDLALVNDDYDEDDDYSGDDDYGDDDAENLMALAELCLLKQIALYVVPS